MENKNSLLNMLGRGVLRSSGNDLALRDEWVALKEREALGEISNVPDYDIWKQSRTAPPQSPVTYR